MQRQVGTLERPAIFLSPQYPPLTSAEVEDVSSCADSKRLPERKVLHETEALLRNGHRSNAFASRREGGPNFGPTLNARSGLPSSPHQALRRSSWATGSKRPVPTPDSSRRCSQCRPARC